MEKINTEIYCLLADVLEYPTASISDQAKACSAALAATNREAHNYLHRFAEFCARTAAGRMEELYTDTFDLEAVCSPYVGFHLFGEDRTRGMFMVRLKEHYRTENHEVDGELPDHIAVMLRFLSDRERNDENMDLICHCVIPAMKKMISLFNEGSNPYRGVLEAALVLLETEKGRS